MAGDAIMGRIVALLDVNDTKFTSGMASAKSKFTGLHSDITSKGKQITGVLGGIGSAMIAIGAIAFLKDSIQAAIEDEVQLVKLRTAVEATGASWSTYADRMNEAATAGIQLGFEDNKTTEALANLTTMTGDAGKAVGALSLAQDLARATGMDLVSATKLVSKVEEGRIGIASRILPFLKTTMTTEEALAALRSHTAGQAAAYAATAAGAQDRWTASTDRLQESIGYKLLPTITGLLDKASALVGAYNSLSAPTQDLTMRMLGFGLAIPIVAVAVTKMVAVLGELGIAYSGIGVPIVGAIAAGVLWQGTVGDMAIATGQWLAETLGFKDTADSFNAAILKQVPALRSVADSAYGAGYSARVLGEAHAGAVAPTNDLAGAVSALAAEVAGYTDDLIYAKNNLTLEQTATKRALTDAIALKSAKSALATAIKTYGKNSNEARLAQINLAEAERKSKDSAAVAADAMNGTATSAGRAAAAYERLQRAVANASARLRAVPNTAVRIPGTQMLLAGGGVITRPTSAIVGEAGTEVVVPTTRDANSYGLLAKAASMLGVGGGGGGLTVNVYADSMSDERRIATAVDGVLRKYARGGRVIAGLGGA